MAGAKSSPQDLISLTRTVHDLQTTMAGVIHSLQHLASSANPPLASPPRDPAQQCQPPSVTRCTSFLDQDTRVFVEDILTGTDIIPREVAAAAVTGAYADLSCFAISASPVSDGERLTLKDGQIIVSACNSGKQISCYIVWLKAWLNYEELLLHQHPAGLSLHRELAAHRQPGAKILFFLALGASKSLLARI